MDKSLISANGTNGGSIALSGKTIISSGTLSSNGSTAKGGRIDIEGTNSIRLLSSDITASGSQQGGLVRIGGAFQGGYDLTRTNEQEETFVTRWGNIPTMENVNTLFINDGSTLNIESDHTPGTLILWSDQETTMLGHINAMGLQGGSVEISSKDTLRYLGLQNIKMVEGGHLLGEDLGGLEALGEEHDLDDERDVGHHHRHRAEERLQILGELGAAGVPLSLIHISEPTRPY